MLRRISRKTSILSKTLKFPAHYPPSAPRPISTFMCLFPKLLSGPQNHILVLKPLLNNKFSDLGMPQNREFLTLVIGPRCPIANPSVSLTYSKDFVTVADEICTDVEEDGELIEKAENLERFDAKKANQVSPAKYKRLRRRQVKVETEAWEAAAKEYKEFLNEMCEQKLAPNLPYMKSLFLGWFEPLMDAIATEQGRCKGANVRAGHGTYIGQLPAEMMAVITMHKLMSLMMSGEGGGGVPVVHAACHIGEAIENEIMVKRQRTAFPPNLVHSLDGSHMMMTAVACKQAGLNFAGVHDSYWTHACDVDEMNSILRAKFVELYETPILENLLESFENSFPSLRFPPLPERGDFDLKGCSGFNIFLQLIRSSVRFTDPI